MDTPLEPLGRIAVALLVGLLIGLDRERAEERKQHSEFAGVRTFPLVALLGCVPMILGGTVGPWLLVAAFVAVATIVALAYRARAQTHIGATTEAAALVTFMLGALAGAGHLVLAGATGVVVAVLLVAKPKLEGFSRAITQEELTAALELAVISVIVLPLLPDEGYGPWGVFNPRSTWLVVVLVAALSFAGFVAVRVVGEEKGLAVTGAIGGLVSSTAVTVAMSDRARENPSMARPAAAAAILASSVMAPRIAVLAGLVDIGVVPRLLPVVLAMALTGGIVAWVLARGNRKEAVAAGPAIKNPFSFRQAVLFGAIYAVIKLAVRAAQEYFGDAGVALAAGLGSVADVDAVTIAFTQLGPGEPPWRMPAAAIAVAAVSNTLVKLGIGAAKGGPAFRRYVTLGLGLTAAAGAAAGLIVYFR